jgi:hypothetical protein
MSGEGSSPRADRITSASWISLANIVPLFSASLFLSALLLFCIQPLFAKMLLPLLGGSPGVWNTAMVFFQTLLLVGYGYAHLSTRLLAPRQQVLLHLALLTLAVLALPIAIRGGGAPPTATSPIPWLMAVLALSIGLPFFVVSATAPLLQRWFSATGHSMAADPYFLYGASNLGSILALLGYPLFLEPLLPLGGQSWFWTWGYLLLVLLIAACGVTFLSLARAPSSSDATPTSKHRPIRWRHRTHWMALATIPSCLLLGVTTEITTDIASAPLFWVVPLMLYLLTFVMVFARRPLLRHRWMVAVFPYLLVLVAISYAWPMSAALQLPINLALFFSAAMICHGELAQRRPGAEDLTDFYLCMSAGGVIGGIFAAILAPEMFNGVYEYPIALVLTCLMLPKREGQPFFNWRDVALPAGLALLIAAPLVFEDAIVQRFGLFGTLPVLVITALAACLFRERPLRFALAMVLLFLAAPSPDNLGRVVHRERSFFGVVKLQLSPDGRVLRMLHGVTAHGAEYADPARWRDPLLYYHPDGPAGQFFAALRLHQRKLDRVGVVGLGTGALTCFREPGQSWSLFEIDPMVVRLARDSGYFHFLEQCGHDTRIVLGDGRLSLQKAADRGLDLVVIDAFSSDAIPIHLLTREAVALYFEKLADHGLLLYHISNRHLELAPVLASIAADAGLVALRDVYAPPVGQEGQSASEWVVLARSSDDLAFLADDPRWAPLDGRPGGRPWTDDYSNLIGAIRR